MKKFLVSATIDFPDDCGNFVFDVELLANLLDRLSWMGVRRVYWLYYSADMWQTFAARQPTTRQTLEILGDPMAVTCQLAHERGMQFYAIIKAYETGLSHAIPAGRARARGQTGLPAIGGVYTWIHPWVMARPELRVRARAGDLPAGLEQVPVQRIQLRQKDLAPVRIKPENLQIWTSEDNDGYRKRDVSFSLSEEVESCPRDARDILGNLVTRKGDAVRVLNVTDLHLLDPFIAVTTDLKDESGSFRNTALEMVRAFGPGDQPLPIVVASHKGLWERPRDLRTGYLTYDGGIGDINVCLDVNNSGQICVHCREAGVTDCGQNPVRPDTEFCRDGVIAFARGRNAYLPGALCEAYPEVQELWLGWVGECLRAGVDGVDWRISNHSCWTDRPEVYGFNAPILEEYRRRYGKNPDREPYDPVLLGDLRGEFYDQFLRRVKNRLSAAGRRMQVHLEVESFRPDAAQARWRTRPGNITFHWRRWLRSGLADEATMMGVNWMPERMISDGLGQQMLDEAQAAHVPVHLRHPVWWSRDGGVHAERLEHVYQSGKLAGYNLYETGAMYDGESLDHNGRLRFYPGLIEGIRAGIEKLGLL